ncbi:MAG: hypothetical protein RJA24_1779 [Pseudomonadota bacterium]|jgi:PAS domain S-box-containing protein
MLPDMEPSLKTDHQPDLKPTHLMLLQEILGQIPLRVFWKDRELRYLGCNSLFAKDAGFTVPEDLIGKDDFQMAWREQAELYRADDFKVMSSGQPKLNYEEPQTAADGRKIWLRTSKVPLRDSKGKVMGLLGLYEDITERKQSEDALRISEHNLTEAQRIAETASLHLDLASGKVTWSHEMYKMFDLDPTQPPPELPAYSRLLTPDSWTLMSEAFAVLIKEGKPYEIELQTVGKTGRCNWILSRGEPVRDANDAITGIRGVSANITRRKEAEITLYNANRALRAISSCNEAMFRSNNETELLNETCALIVEIGEYRMAWIGYTQDNAEKSVNPMAMYGVEEGYLEGRQFSWDENSPAGRGPTGNAIRTGKPQINQNFLTNPALGPWREAALQRGYQSSIALPLISKTQTFGALMIYAPEPDAFSAAEVALLEDLAKDLSFGIETLRTRAERDRIAEENQRHMIAQQQSLKDFVRVIASTVEMRDPYTAGHQYRVSQLAIAIGREMGLSEHTVNGLELAGMVHDVGQINVPAEILCRPGKLSTNEYLLIKQHPQTGYATLKDIQFPWPIATIVLQHHERLDGSGYPQGLKGDQILLESRIMAVADVTEAMSSHRPYRPARTLDAVIDELQSGSGTRYDKAAVDACLTLLREKGFSFKH